MPAAAAIWYVLQAAISSMGFLFFIVLEIFCMDGINIDNIVAAYAVMLPMLNILNTGTLKKFNIIW